jgi:hypothetical protein
MLINPDGDVICFTKALKLVLNNSKKNRDFFDHDILHLSKFVIIFMLSGKHLYYFVN